MTDVIETIGQCPPEAQEASMLVQKCFEVTKDINRIMIKDPDGVDPFNGTPLADAAALKTAIETKTIWDAAIAAASPDGIMFTPAIQDAQRPKQLIEPVELPNTQRILPGTIADVTSTYTLYGISSENHVRLLRLTGTVREFMLMDVSGNTIYKDLTDAEVAAGASPWFRANLFNVSTRDVLTGAGNTDNADIQMFTTFGELDRFTTAQTGAFGLIL